jgi:hypothetical protein
VPETTPAETLRNAATLMRKQAEAAQPGPWTVDTWRGLGGTWASVMVPFGHPAAPTAKTGLTAMAKLGTQDAATAGHIASWDPPAALLVADLLETTAQCGCEEDDDHWPQKAAALAFARLFLGEVSDA